MTAYFNPADQNDLAYLPENFRQDSRVAALAPIVEADVIGEYTRSLPSTFDLYRINESVYPLVVIGTYERLGTYLGVFLRGYKADASDSAVDPYFKVAMKRAIAEVLVWRIQQVRVDPMVESESADNKSKTYRPEASEPFPPSWKRWLLPFETQEVNWAL